MIAFQLLPVIVVKREGGQYETAMMTLSDYQLVLANGAWLGEPICAIEVLGFDELPYSCVYDFVLRANGQNPINKLRWKFRTCECGEQRFLT
jgi:hypothetical protein